MNELATLEEFRAPALGRLLVVDDNDDNRTVLIRQLESHGYDVAGAENGGRALELIRKDDFDLVLLDIRMPEKNGYEVLRILKGDAGTEHIPVIMISGLSEMEAVARCIEMGAEDYLPKPFNSTLLQARIGASLGKKLARDREKRYFEELQQNYKRLQELEQLRDDLTYMIVHDLRTPLTSVIAGMQTLEHIGTLNDEQREVIGISVQGAEGLLGLINDLLDVVKLESGAMLLDFQLLSPDALACSCIHPVIMLAETKGLTISQSYDEDLPAFYGDEGKLCRTLVNLISNAIKFTPSGGTVDVGVRLDSDRDSILFTVRDTGEGIPPDAFGRIFEKFGQVDSRKAGRKLSTGLGLTFCKLVVEGHGGEIWVDSAPGQGSTFSFTIPRSQKAL